ncbi:MAG: tetratricopeptide repeat protein, partial [Deltaproteobacteria bacterium]|nr:tetratricopeptide repeat protein [Deltaproteobacteria bacterium]
PPRAAARRAAPPPPGASLDWRAALLVALAAFAVYANSLSNGFVWDDPIILSRQLVVFRSAADVLAPPRDIPQFSPDYYRPLTIATYLLDRAIGGERPFVFHLSVVLTHALAAVLVWALAAQLLAARPRPPTAQRGGALCAGLLFAVHPVHTESVAWAAGRSDVLATACVLAALLAQRAWLATWLGGATSGAAALAALGAKETGVALYPLALLRDLLLPPPVRPSRAAWLRGYAGLAVAALVYAALRRHALGEAIGSVPHDAPVVRGAGEVLGAVGTYLGLLLWPWPLNAYIDAIPSGPLPLLAAAAFALGGAMACLRWWRDGDGLPLFALGWIGLTLVPSLAILWKIPDAPLAERYLYLPSVGWCLLVGALAAAALARLGGAARRAVAAGAALLLVVAGVATWSRNPVWHDDLALWTDTEAKSQRSGMAARNLGTAYQTLGRAAEARAAFARALTRRNDARGLQTIHNNLGSLAMLDGDFAAARRAYEQALRQAPNASDTIFNLGLAILQGGGSTPEAARQALPHFERAAQINPHDADIQAGLGQAYLILGERERALPHLRRALELNPSPHTAEGVRALLRQAGG